MKVKNSLFFISFLYLLIVLFVPLLFLVISAIHLSPNKYLFEVLDSALLQSILQASVSTLLAGLLGLSIGLLLLIYNGRFREVIISFMLITYVMPGLIMAIGIISLFNYGNRFLEIVLGNVIFNSPMIALLSYSTGSSTSIKEVNSAKVLGASDLQIINRFYLRNSERGALLGSLFSFILCFEGFSLPLIIGGPHFSTVEVLIYLFKRIFVFYSSYQFSAASFIALIQFMTLIIPLFVYISLRPPPSNRGQGVHYSIRGSKIALSLLIVFLIFLFIPLLFIFLKYPLNPVSLLNIEKRIGISIYALTLNTILFSISSTMLSFLISLIFVSRSSSFSKFTVMLPLIVSPVSLSLGFYLAYGEISSSALLLIFIFTALEIPITIRMIQQAVDTIPVSERMSSRILGDAPFSSLIKVQLPAIRNEVTSVLSLIFITVIGEFSAIATVYTKSTETITIGIYQLLLLKDLVGAYTLTEIFIIVIFMSSLFINYVGKSDLIGKTYS